MFANAQARAEKFSSFQVPSNDELRLIDSRHHVKVCAKGERFWVKVEWAANGEVSGTVSNQLALTLRHGFSYGDKVTFKLENVFEVFEWDDIPF